MPIAVAPNPRSRMPTTIIPVLRRVVSLAASQARYPTTGSFDGAIAGPVPAGFGAACGGGAASGGAAGGAGVVAFCARALEAKRYSEAPAVKARRRIAFVLASNDEGTRRGEDQE